MNKKASEQVEQANKDIFSELINELSGVEQDKRERGGESKDNLKQGYATLVKQASKQSKDGYVYVMHNANILSEQVLKALKCNSGERARVDKNKANWLLSKQASELKMLKIKVSESLKSELEQELKKQGKARAKAYLFSSK